MSIVLKENLEKVLEQIEEAKKKSKYNEDVKLIAVTKTHPVEVIREALALGVTDIGENKVQELTGKIDEIGDAVNYHMIGRLQTNKIKYIVGKVSLIQSIDREPILAEIDKRSAKAGIITEGLIQVNVAGEEQKGGVCYDDVYKFIELCQKYGNIRIRGLMTVAPYTEDKDFLRDVFRKMRSLYDKIASENYDNLRMDYLSMGMSSDFELAIEEGANMVRIGSKIFGERDYRR